MPAGFTWTPERRQVGQLIIVSQRIAPAMCFVMAWRIGRAAIGGVERLSGTHIYAPWQRWMGVGDAIGFQPRASAGARRISRIWQQRMTIAPEFLSNARRSLLRARPSFLRMRRQRSHPSAPGFNPHYSDEIAISLLTTATTPLHADQASSHRLAPCLRRPRLPNEITPRSEFLFILTAMKTISISSNESLLIRNCCHTRWDAIPVAAGSALHYSL